jgi:hypothetical protein
LQLGEHLLSGGPCALGALDQRLESIDQRLRAFEARLPVLQGEA